MLGWALAFFVFTLASALLGFGGLATASAGLAQTLFYVFLVLFLVTLITGLLTGKRPVL